VPITEKTILIADDDDDIRLALELLLTMNGYRIIEASTPGEAVIQAERHKPDLVLLDMNFSRDTTSGLEGLKVLEQLQGTAIPVILMTAWGSIDLAVQGLKAGACDFIEKPWNKDKVLNDIAQQISHARIKQEHDGYRQLLSADLPERHQSLDWVSQSKAMQAIDELVTQVAVTDANVLILGENGTGKSLLAERLHQLSGRAGNPFIAVNMAAIPDSLFESELFGHQKGAFTDAKQQRLGRFQLANQGSLFLDEIGTLPLNLQPKLLRVLESGQYEVLGSSHTQFADVRMISATNADLDLLVAEGAFRQDLLYRLNTLVITMPALRQRRDDIEPLASHFNTRFSQKYRKPVAPLLGPAIEKLQQHEWPGNIRELSHVIERAVLLNTQASISAAQLMLDSAGNSRQQVKLQSLEQAERQLIQQSMETAGGNVAEAAKSLEISRNALYRRLEKHNIDFSDSERDRDHGDHGDHGD